MIEQFVDMGNPEDYNYTDDNYTDDDCTVNVGDGVMDVACQFTGEIPNSNGCTYTADVTGGGTYTETSFEYDTTTSTPAAPPAISSTARRFRPWRSRSTSSASTSETDRHTRSTHRRFESAERARST